MDEGARSRIPRDDERTVAPNFVTAAVDRDLASGRVERVVTRFPPEPNGYLHIGHAKAICLDFGVAADYGGVTYLRLDDTNPVQEDPEFVDAIQRDVAWLGFEWIALRHASDYFERLYELARTLIRRGDAYVDSQDLDTIRATRGTVTTPGTPSPDRDRPAEESLALFEAMRRGDHPEGAYVLRAKIDMASPNMILRDPVLYRILHATHHRTGDAWHVYPMYDFAHPLSDAIEGVTHSLCTLEFENNRAIYDWLVERLFDEPVPRQYEFNRLELDHTVVSKRKLAPLVDAGLVDGWDDPRMPTLAALRRRGVTPAAIRDFANRVGVTKTNARTDVGLLEASIRDDLNAKAPRVMAVLDPVPLTVEGLDEGDVGVRDAPLWPHDVPREGDRPLTLAREVWVERGDVARDPPKGWKRFAPGATVRLRHGPVVRCDRVDVADDGRVTAVHGTAVDPGADDVKVAGVVHWVARSVAVPATFQLVDRLFPMPDPGADDRDVAEKVDPGALRTLHGVVEPYVLEADPATRWQFERQGYFWRDPAHRDADGPPVFLRIVTLKDGWAKAEAPAPRRERRPAPAAPTAPDPEPDKAATLDAEGRARLARLEGLGVAHRDAARLAEHADVTGLVEAAHGTGAGASAAALANWALNELPRALTDAGDRPLADAQLGPAAFAELVALVEEGVVSGPTGKALLAELVTDGGSARERVEARGLARIDDADALTETVAEVLDAHPDEVATYLGGKEGLIGFFVGAVLRATDGRADPAAVREALTAALDARR